jgi:hypothetical protein
MAFMEWPSGAGKVRSVVSTWSDGHAFMPGAQDWTVRVMSADGFHWISFALRPPIPSVASCPAPTS